ncbi:hypothetical protein G6F27_014158 [Rhizopus arrhizus]|nr:hypothetical protein G6F27_014158 [Rhizopus arrhizus]
MSGKTIGSVRWMAPELFDNKTPSFSSDIYALGIVLWEISSHGQPPYADIQNDVALSLKILKGHREKIPDDTPLDYKQKIEQCWHANPARRPDAKDLIAMDDHSDISSIHSDDHGTIIFNRY